MNCPMRQSSVKEVTNGHLVKCPMKQLQTVRLGSQTFIMWCQKWQTVCVLITPLPPPLKSHIVRNLLMGHVGGFLISTRAVSFSFKISWLSGNSSLDDTLLVPLLAFQWKMITEGDYFSLVFMSFPSLKAECSMQEPRDVSLGLDEYGKMKRRRSRRGGRELRGWQR